MSNPNQAAHSHRSHHKKECPQSFSAMIKCVLLAVPLTVLLGALLLLIATAVLLSLSNPIHYRGAVGLLALYLTAALGGGIATRLYGRRAPLLCGLFEGICLLILLSLPAFFISGNLHPSAALFWRLLLLPACVIGAFVCGGKRKTRHRRH